MNYSRIIDRAFEITWRHKILWAFGIAMALFGGMGGIGNPGSGFQYRFSGNDWARQAPYWGRMPFEWNALLPGILAILGMLVLLALLWAIVGIIVRYTSIGALIGMTKAIEAGETPSFRSGLQCGWRRLLQLFLIGLVIGITGILIGIALVVVLLVLAGVLAIPAVVLFSGRGGWAALGVIYAILAGLGFIGIAILAALAVAGALSVTREYAFRASVLQKQDVFDAISAGFRLLRENLKESAWMWVLLGLIEMALGIVLIPIIILVGIAVAIPLAAIATAARAMWLLLLVGIPLVVVAAIALIVIYGVYEAFRAVTWTLFYEKLHSPGEVASGSPDLPTVPQEGTV